MPMKSQRRKGGGGGGFRIPQRCGGRRGSTGGKGKLCEWGSGTVIDPNLPHCPHPLHSSPYETEITALDCGLERERRKKKNCPPASANPSSVFMSAFLLFHHIISFVKASLPFTQQICVQLSTEMEEGGSFTVSSPACPHAHTYIHRHAHVHTRTHTQACVHMAAH